MKVYITSSFGDSKETIESICLLVINAGFEDFRFIRDVEGYKIIFDNPTHLMSRSADEIRNCDALLIDMTDKPTGRAIEAGMAYAFGKPIIVIMKRGTVIKDTTRGIAHVVIEYDQLEDITDQLSQKFTD